MLARGAPTGHKKTVATVWTLAFEDLQQRAPGAVGLLRLLAYCAPEAIPLHLLLQPRPGLGDQLGPEVAPVLVPLLENELAAKDAIAALRRYSLVIPAGGGSVSVHRLVQAVTADQMPADLARQWRQAAAVLIEAAIPGNTDLPETWPVCAALLPHAEAALADASAGMARLANYLGCRGSYAAAAQLHQRIVDARDQALGREHPGTLAARNNLAYWTGEAGDRAGARDQFAALVPAMTRVLGGEHPQTLAARRGLAAWTGAAGDTAGARDEFAELLRLFERVLGPGHPDTLDIRGNLAVWTGQAGDAAAARDQYAALLPVAERVLGSQHPDALDVRGNLADWTGKAGDASAARDQYAALLPVRERVLGPEHPEILTDRASLAHWTGEAGDAAAARDQYAALLTDRVQVVGADHPDTLDTRGSLAHWTEKAERDTGPDVGLVSEPSRRCISPGACGLSNFLGRASDLPAQFPAPGSGVVPPALLGRPGAPGWYRDGPPVGAHGDHREVAAVSVPDDMAQQVLRRHSYPDLHRRTACPVDAGLQRHQFTDVDGFPEDDLVDGERDGVVPRIAGCAGVRDLVEVLQQKTAVDVAGEVRHIRGHQDGHRQAVQTVTRVVTGQVVGTTAWRGHGVPSSEARAVHG